MSERELSILVKAKGALAAAAQLGKVDSAVGSIGTSASRGAKFALAGLGAGGLVAGGLIAKGVMEGIGSLQLLEQVTNQTGAVLTSTGGAAGVTSDQVRKLAESLEGVTTADDKAIQGGENLLLTFTGIGKDVFPQATKAMVDMAIAMAQGDVEAADFKATALQVGKALNSPEEGLTALKKAGVSFTKQQQDQIKTLVASGRTVDAQKIMLAELEREFGKAGEAAGRGFGADMRRVKDSVEDAEAALATGFLPVITKVSDLLSSELAKPSTIAGIKDFGQGLAGGLDTLIDTARGLPWDAIGSSLKIAGDGAKTVLGVFTGLPPWIQTAVLTGWGLDKLTGGAASDIVEALGKGLIKGVLGMNAGVVNINAGVVNGAGGVAGAAGGGGGGAERLITGVVGSLGIGAAVGGGVLSLQDIQTGTEEGVKSGLLALAGGPAGLIGRAVGPVIDQLLGVTDKVNTGVDQTTQAVGVVDREIRERSAAEVAASDRVTSAVERARLAIQGITLKPPTVTIVGSTVVTVSSQTLSSAATTVSNWTGSTKYATAV